MPCWIGRSITSHHHDQHRSPVKTLIHSLRVELQERELCRQERQDLWQSSVPSVQGWTRLIEIASHTKIKRRSSSNVEGGRWEIQKPRKSRKMKHTVSTKASSRCAWSEVNLFISKPNMFLQRCLVMFARDFSWFYLTILGFLSVKMTGYTTMLGLSFLHIPKLLVILVDRQTYKQVINIEQNHCP